MGEVYGLSPVWILEKIPHVTLCEQYAFSINYLTYCGLVIPYGDIDLGQF